MPSRLKIFNIGLHYIHGWAESGRRAGSWVIALGCMVAVLGLAGGRAYFIFMLHSPLHILVEDV
jgi:hypothetical protein